VLGVNPDEEYRSETFNLQPGASVILYTDGVVEAESTGGKQYGVERLLTLLQTHSTKGGIDPGDRIRAILEDVKKFSSNHELLDDVTLVALRTSTAPVESVIRSR